MGVQEKAAGHLDAIERVIVEMSHENPDIGPWAARIQGLVTSMRIELDGLDRKKKYLEDVRVPVDGTLLVFHNGARHRPIRLRVKGTTAEHITLLSPSGREVKFHLSSGLEVQAGGLTMFKRADPDVIEKTELEVFKKRMKEAVTSV